MNIDQEDLIEERGKISFIEYTPTGIFILKIKERKYRGTQIQSQVFQLDDEVHIIYERRTNNVYAVLNESRQILYLNENVVATESSNHQQFSKTAYHFSVAVTLFLAIAYPMYQYFMDGTIYYIDTVIHLIILAFILFVGRFIYEYANANNQNKVGNHQIWERLNLPVFSGNMLRSLHLMNGYYFEFEKLYDLKPIFQLKQSMSNEKVEQYFAEQLKSKNKFGLSQFEIEKYQVHLMKGNLSDIDIECMESNRDNPDPLDEVKFKVNQQKLYGFFDDFNFTSGRDVQVVASKCSDKDGHYTWLVSDQLLYLSVDEELLTQRNKSPFKLFKSIEQIGETSIVLFWAAFILIIFFDFISMIILAGILGILYIYGQFCYSVYLKLNNKRDIHGFVFEQISKLLPSVNLNTFDKNEYVPCFNLRRSTQSRTGFKKEHRVL